MRDLLLAALVAVAPLAWGESAGAQILAQAPISLSGSRAGEPATGVQLLVGFDDQQSWTDDPVLFDQVIWTPEDVGRVVSIGSFLDDPDFPAASGTLTDGLPSLVSIHAFIEPGGGGPGMGTTESNLFADALQGGIDFAPTALDAIALRLDALTLNDPSQGSIDVQLTLLVIGGAGGSAPSPELAQCTADLEEARSRELQCAVRNVELEATLAGLEQSLLACEGELDSIRVEVSRLGAELELAEWAANEAQAELATAQAQLATAQSALAAALADVDADGVRDPGDACLGTETAAAVDGMGCSLAQFCSAIDATTGSGRSTCNHSDWLNDEPLSDSPNDCKASAGRCEPR